MAFQRSRSRGRSQGSVRRKTSWQVGSGGNVATLISATGSTILGVGSFSTEDGLTATRIRGELLIGLESSSQVNGGFVGAFGIGLTDISAFAIGVTAVQTPLADADWDQWLFHRFFACRSAGLIGNVAADDVDIVHSVVAAMRLEVDTKAMRKLPEDVGVYACIEVTESGAATMRVDFDSRMLIFLP